MISVESLLKTGVMAGVNYINIQIEKLFSII